MNNDEMNNDAAFDAFLRGEGELSRALQSMPQASPSAELDAAIRARIRTSMAQQSAEAANDPGAASGTPMLAPGLGLRWRVPAGLAATLLAGLFATQAYQENDARQRMDLPIEEHAVVAPAPVMAPPPATEAAPDTPQVQAPVVLQQTPSAPSAPAAPLRRVPKAPVIVAAPARVGPIPTAPERASAPATTPAAATPALAPPIVTNARSAKPAAQSDAVVHYASREAAKAAPAPAPIPQEGVAAPADDKSQLEASVEGRAPVSVITPEPASRVELSGSRIGREGTPSSPAAWVGQIETLLKEGRQDEARREWIRLRQHYPQYQAPEPLNAQLKALLE